MTALCLATPGSAAGQAAAGRAVTLRPLSIVKLLDLDFGRAIPGLAPGTIVINATTDARTTTGGVTAAGGAPTAAQFYTYGGPLQFVQVTRGPLPVLSNGSGGTMPVTALTLNGPTFRFLNSAGLLDLRVGGTLSVGANQADGSYAGTFVITVDYF